MKSGRIVRAAARSRSRRSKNLYFGQERTWWRKAREALMSVILDARYSKDRILEVYLNEVYLGQRGSVSICGVQAASRYFFGRNVSDLSLAEAATLAGTDSQSRRLQPVHASGSRGASGATSFWTRCSTLGFADKAAVARAKAEPLRVASGGAGYAQRALRRRLRARAARGALLDRRCSPENGLEIYTTIDTLVQTRAEDALERGLDRLESGHPAHPPAEDTTSAAGLRRRDRSALRRDPRARRRARLPGQPVQSRDAGPAPAGVVLQAVRLPRGVPGRDGGERGGLTPASILDDSPFELVSGGQTWRPANYDGEFLGPCPARAALEGSRNVPTARAAQAVGMKRVDRGGESVRLHRALRSLAVVGSRALRRSRRSSSRRRTARSRRSALRVQPRIIQEVVARDGRKLEKRTPRCARPCRRRRPISSTTCCAAS